MTQEEITTTMTVKRSSTVEGRNGPQWALTVTWPWTIGLNTDSVWLEKSEYPHEPTPGTYPVAVEHRTVKNKKEGGQHDGSQPWMWNWRVVRFIGPQPTVSSQADRTEKRQTNGASTPATWEEQTVRGYDLGMAFNKAVDIVIAESARRTQAGEPEPIYISRIRQWRDMLLREVIMTTPAPPHWCYLHGVQQIQSTKTGVWGHVLEDKTVCVKESP